MTKIHAETIGSGPVLVMIHGWSMHSGVWRDLVRQLSRHFKVVCLDLPGHGHSESCDPYQLATVSDALAAAIADERFTLLGWSLGASVAIDMAHRYPERVERLVLLAGNPCFVERADWPGISANVLTMFSDNLMDNWQQTLVRFLTLQVNGLPDGKKRLKQLKDALQQAPAADLPALKAGLRLLHDTDARAVFQHLKQPVLAFFAEQDVLIPLACMDAMKRLKPEVNIQLLEGAGHAPFFTHSDDIESAVYDFIHAGAE